MIGVLTTHHCHNGLLPSLVAPSQDAEMAWQNTSSFPLCPDHRPGHTLMSARPDLCGGHRATGVPTAITNHCERAAVQVSKANWYRGGIIREGPKGLFSA